MEVQWINVPNMKDPRGNLAVLENSKLPFDVKRVYYLYDVPSGSARGGHALKTTTQLLIPLNGSFEVALKKGGHELAVLMNDPTRGLLINPITWREMTNFSAGSVCLVLASKEYSEEDYIRDYAKYNEMTNNS